MNKKILAILIILAVAAAGAGIILHKKYVLKHLAPPPNPPIPVSTVVVKDGSVGSTVDTVALVVSQTAATVSAQVPGSLLEVRFHEGDSVRKGQVMARIDPSVLNDAVHTAQARLAAVREDLAKEEAIYGRDKVLYENQAISRQALDISKARLAAAKAAEVSAGKSLASARTYRSYADVPAPYSGVVTGRLVEPGDLAAPGKPLYTLQVPGGAKLVSKLSQDSLAQLKTGDVVTFRQGTQKTAARTSRIYPALDAAHLGTVETDLPTPPFDLKTGATVSASYAAATLNGLVVPTSALLKGLSETLVIRVKDGKSDPVPVTLSSENGTQATVIGDIHPGDVLATGLPSELMALTAGTPLAPRGR